MLVAEQCMDKNTMEVNGNLNGLDTINVFFHVPKS